MRNRKYGSQYKSTPKNQRGTYQSQFFVVKTTASGEILKMRATEFEREYVALGFEHSSIVQLFASMKAGTVFSANNAEYRAEKYF